MKVTVKLNDGIDNEIELDVDEAAFTEAQENGMGLYYLADKGNMLYEILQQMKPVYLRPAPADAGYSHEFFDPTGSL